MKHLRQYIRQMLIEAAGSDAFGAPYFSPPQVFKDETGIDLVHRYKLPPRFSSGKVLQDWTDENEPKDPTPADINDFYAPLVDELIKLNPELTPLRDVGEVEEWMLLPDQEMSEVYPWHLKDIVIGIASEFPPADLLYFWDGSRDISWDIGTQIEKKIGVRPQWMMSPKTAEKHFDLQEHRIRGYIRRILLETAIDSKIEGQIEKLIDLNLTIGLTFNDYGDWVSVAVEFLDENDRRVGELKANYDEKGKGTCNRALTISQTGVRVSHGLGPLAYDLAFELASLAGLAGLGPDAREVSDAAKGVWDYYLNNRGDVTAKQRDFKENPQTTPLDDDCLGQDTLADRFPGGREKAYTKKTHHDPVGFDDPEEGWDTVEEYSAEFIEYYFDPKNSLSKTYHKDASGTPILKYLRSKLRLHPFAATKIGMSYTREEVEDILEKNPSLYKKYFEEKRGKYNSKTRKWDSAPPTTEEKEAWIMNNWINPK